jgi:hypothetical protein
MSKDEIGSGKGFDEEKFKQMQNLLGQYVNLQDQAVLIPCPYCQGKLERNDIGTVKCRSCDHVFLCQALVESQKLSDQELFE